MRTPLLVRFYREIASLKKELRAGSRVARTSAGPVEYATLGEGPPILVVHGIAGGYDQGLLVSRLRDEFPVKLMAVSRPGYLRTPLRSGQTWEAQADLYAALLDALRIEKVPIVGLSGGGPSSLLFALRHPDRCSALLMVSAVSMRLDPQLSPTQRALLAALNTDLGLWLMGNYSEKRLMALNGVGERTIKHIRDDPAKQHLIRKLVEPLPMSLRRAGFNNDLRQFPLTPRIHVEEIKAPTLVVHGSADQVVPTAHAEFVARGVPGAELLYIEGGGHLCPITHSEVALPAIMEFLATHASVLESSRKG